MKDNEIIKALECCSGTTCKGCPFQEGFGKDAPCPNLKKYALDLIRRQQAEIERLQDIIISNDEERLSSSAIMMKKEQELMHAERISGLEAEIERLIYKLECLLCYATASKLSKHTYDLKTMEVAVTDAFNETYDEGYNEGKAEARKEFAERVREKAREIKINYVDDTSIQERKTGWYEISKLDFDSLLAEMESERE